MAKKVRYGVISDIHQNVKLVSTVIDALKSQGAEKLIINGDIADTQNTLEDSQNHIAFVLNTIGKSNLETFVQPGSHETLLAYEPVINYFSDKYSNIIDAIKNQKAEQENHHLIFLPGSDFLCGGEYCIRNDEKILSGKYINENGKKLIHYFNMHDLKKLVTVPEKTILVCHVPRKFDNLETAVDMAEFGEAVQDFDLNKDKIERGSVFPYKVAEQIIKLGYPVKLKKENRGNEDLKKIYDELGIIKAVNGHFHESGHRACDKNGNYIGERENIRELFWNSGCLDYGQAGILTVDSDKINYQNIKLFD